MSVMLVLEMAWWYDYNREVNHPDYCHWYRNMHHPCDTTTLTTTSPTTTTVLFDYIEKYAAKVDFDIMRGYHDFAMVRTQLTYFPEGDFFWMKVFRSTICNIHYHKLLRASWPVNNQRLTRIEIFLSPRLVQFFSRSVQIRTMHRADLEENWLVIGPDLVRSTADLGDARAESGWN